ncbi:MAG: flagellar biosynthesis protein FlhA [Planctomycetota bacterium]
MSDAASSNMPPWLAAIYRQRGLIAPVAFVMLLGVILVPLPPAVMDVLISLNVSLAVIVLLTTVYMSRPIEFSVFPSLLLATTLFRLVLNIASTRLILSADAQSPEGALGVAGKVISAFGDFVAGKSPIVGVIIFLILILVQFLVITKGATRISEVAARFTLDAMPGKQMAIDADVAAGTIDEGEARQRREEIRREADFFGAMDGASKFVRGDAIAGLIITAINIAGGFAIGAIEKGWPPGQTLAVFTKLTIGDGIASALPSFVIAIASALIVTRSGDKADLGSELASQLTSQPQGLFLTSGFLSLLAFTPLPTVPLLASAAGIGLIGYGIVRAERSRMAGERVEAEQEAAAAPAPEQTVEDLIKVDVLELEVGYNLVPLVESRSGPGLLDRISATRRQLAVELGLVMPPVRIRDNVQADPRSYRLKIRGAVVAEATVEPDRLMAMDPGIATGKVEGISTREPAFGLDAWWIHPDQKQRAEGMNYTVVDPTSVIATHVSEVVKSYADELLTREEVNNLLTQLKEQSPKLVEDTVPSVVTVQQLQRVLQGLLRERVPVRDLESIVETLSEWAPKTKDVDVLIEYVRNGLKRAITQMVAERDEGDEGTKVFCVALDPSLESQIESYIDRSGGITNVSVPVTLSRQIARAASEKMQVLAAEGHAPVLLASPAVRAVAHQLLAETIPGVSVIAYNEIAQGVAVESMGLVSLEATGAGGGGAEETSGAAA